MTTPRFGGQNGTPRSSSRDPNATPRSQWSGHGSAQDPLAIATATPRSINIPIGLARSNSNPLATPRSTAGTPRIAMATPRVAHAVKTKSSNPLGCVFGSCDTGQDFGSEPPLQNMFGSKQQEAQLSGPILVTELMVMMRRVYKENEERQQRMMEGIIQYHCKGIADQQEMMSQRLDKLVGRQEMGRMPPSCEKDLALRNGAGDDEKARRAGRRSTPGEIYAAKMSSAGEEGSTEEDPKDATEATLQQRPTTTTNAVDDDMVPKTWGESIVTGTLFEVGFGFLIVLNTVNMCVECEYKGIGLGHTIGVEGAQATTATGDFVFMVIDMFFAVIFSIEVVAKLAALQWAFWKSWWNVFDFCVIGFSWFDKAVDVKLPINPMLLRLVRLVRLLRLLKTLRAYEVFDNLFLMVKGIQAATPVLIWVVVLLLPIMSTCALAMNYTLLDYINDPSNDMKHRVECYRYFGSFSRALLSMFEITFASFVPIMRFLYRNVDEKWAVFIVLYKMIMGIAVLRIIYAVFMHVTFACADADEETIVLKKERQEIKHANKMRALFAKFDTTGDGTVDKEEFLEICKDRRLKAFLAAEEIDVQDAGLVFDLTDDGDGTIGPDEMSHGFTRLKGAARSLDILALMHLTREVLEKVDRLEVRAAVDSLIGPKWSS